MFDSLEVKVLCPSGWRRRASEAQGRRREAGSEGSVERNRGLLLWIAAILRPSGRSLLFAAPDQRTRSLQVLVRDNNVDQALRVLKKKMQREGVFREMKQRKAYEKPSERKTREKAEAVRRARKAARKTAIREGLIAAPKPKPRFGTGPRRPGMASGDGSRL
jgi:small subunit ribosomal protein S21